MNSWRMQAPGTKSKSKRVAEQRKLHGRHTRPTPQKQRRYGLQQNERRHGPGRRHKK